MPRHDRGAVQVLGPVNGAQGEAASDSQKSHGEQVNDTSLPSEEHIAAVLNSHSTNKKSAAALIDDGNRGIFNSITRVIGWSGKVQGATEHHPKSDSNVGSGYLPGPLEVAEESITTVVPTATDTVASTTMPATNPTEAISRPSYLTKRKQPAERDDIYAYPASSEGDTDRQVEDMERPVKRVKHNLRGQRHVNRPVRRHSPPQLQEPEESSHPTERMSQSRTSNKEENSGLVELDQPLHKRRGRPPKVQQKDTDKQVVAGPPDNNASKSLASTPGLTNFTSEQRPGSVGSTSKPPVAPPSCITTASLSTPSQTSRKKKLKAKTCLAKRVGSYRDMLTDGSSDQDEEAILWREDASTAVDSLEVPRKDGEEDGDEKDADDEEAKDQSRHAAQDSLEQLSSFELDKQVADLKFLDEMIETLRRAGHTKSNATREELETHTRLSSKAGEKLQRGVEQLQEAYQKMRGFLDAEDESALEQTHAEVKHYIDELKMRTSAMLEKRLGPLNDEAKKREARRALLTDLYSKVLPTFMETLKTGVNLYSRNGDLATPALEEVTGIIKMIHSLAEGATRQPKEVQPKADKKRSYVIQKLTKQVLPELRRLQKDWEAELKSREQEERIAKIKREAPERERRRKEREEREEEERRRTNEAKIRAQEQILAKNMNDPRMCSTAFTATRVRRPITQNGVTSIQRLQSQINLEQRALEKAQADEQVRKLKTKLQEAECLAHEKSLAYERGLRLSATGDGDLEDDELEERLYLFGEKNLHEISKTREWSAEEKTTLIDILRDRQGQEDVYEFIAQELDRTLEEVFEKVKDFKDAMEVLREQGRFTGRDHAWIGKIEI